MKQSIIEIDFKKNKAQQKKPEQPTLFLGRQVELVGRISETSLHGVIGDYQLSIDKSIVTDLDIASPNTTGFLWDSDVECRTEIAITSSEGTKYIDKYSLQTGDTQLIYVTLNEPVLSNSGNITRLSITPEFEFRYANPNFDACLGMIRLVTSTRVITLDNNQVIAVLDTSDHALPVLYFENKESPVIVDPICTHHEMGSIQNYQYTYTVSQDIPESINGRQVTSVIVLEQYSNFLMQQENDKQKAPVIWTPAHAPIQWGWSMCIQPRQDNSWYIARRKLMMPIVGNDGLMLPLWKGNVFTCGNR